MNLLRHEREAWKRGVHLIGIDEVGRGPLAGPVVAAAVCFPMGHQPIAGVQDSKKVKTAAAREELALLVRQQAMAVGLGAASVREIARLNIRRATALAMRRALFRCRAGLVQDLMVEVLIDGLMMPELQEPHRALVRGDEHCHAIASASLVAKVARDQLMNRLAVRRPGYAWETNVGYGTREHIAALRALGLTPHHRVQFCETATQTEMWVNKKSA